MPCYEPDIMVLDTATNPKTKIKYLSHWDPEFKGYEYYSEMNEKFMEQGSSWKCFKVPCGNCAGCQEQYSKTWAQRCLLESQLWPFNWFITLTYDDEHLHKEKVKDPNTGIEYEAQEGGILEPRDWTLFMKRLRKEYNKEFHHQGIRFYAAGEYGDTTGRAHMHALLFNFPIPDAELKIHKIENGNPIFEYKRLERIWGNGFVSVAAVNWDTCAYVARYVMKKLKYKPWKRTIYESGRTPEFVRMSRKPGIGAGAFDEEFYNFDEIILPGHNGCAQRATPSRYFDKIYEKINPENMEKVKEERIRRAEANLKAKMQNTTLTEMEQLQVEERIKRDVWKSLARNKI